MVRELRVLVSVVFGKGITADVFWEPLSWLLIALSRKALSFYCLISALLPASLSRADSEGKLS